MHLSIHINGSSYATKVALHYSIGLVSTRTLRCSTRILASIGIYRLAINPQYKAHLTESFVESQVITREQF